MDIPQFRFADIEVDAAIRQLTRAGQAVRIEPKVFDALVLLLRHRHRVVTKQELLAGVWHRMVVTDGVIARTVMKVRRAVETPGGPPLVKTVHRVGYRFIAEVEEGPARAGAGASRTAPAADGDAGAVRIAVLPFANETGERAFAWTELGLMSTTADELARLLGPAAVVPLAQLLAVAASVEAEPLLETVAGRLAAALGPVEVVRAALSQAADAAPTLDFAAHGPTLGTLHGRVAGGDPVRLSRQIAQRIAARCGAGRPPQSCDERFAAQARARASKALGEERWGHAAALLRVAMDQRPHDPQLQLDHARCLVGQRDPRALGLLEAALRDARQDRDTARELRALHLLVACRHARGELAEAERLLGDALRQAESTADAGAELQLLLAGAETLTCLDKPAVATWMLDRAATLAARLAHPTAMARLADVRGRIALYRAEAPGALQCFEEAARLSERHGLSAGAAYSLAHVGHCLRDLGRTAEAADRYLCALDHALRCGDPCAVGLAGVCVARFATGPRTDPAACDSLLERMRRAAALPAAIDLAGAWIHARDGRLQPAAELLDHLQHRAVRSPSLGYHATVLQARILVRQGLPAQALDLANALRARAAGRLQRAIRGSSLHLRALVAAAEGAPRPALALLHDSLREHAPSAARCDAVLDAAWLHLQLGERAEARQLLAPIESFMQAAAASGYAPALAVQARWRGAPGQAVATELPSLLELAVPGPLPALQAA